MFLTASILPMMERKKQAKQNKSRHDRCAFLGMCSFHESKAEKGDLGPIQTSSKGGLQTRSQSSIEFSAKSFRKLRCLNVQQLLQPPHLRDTEMHRKNMLSPCLQQPATNTLKNCACVSRSNYSIFKGTRWSHQVFICFPCSLYFVFEEKNVNGIISENDNS